MPVVIGELPDGRRGLGTVDIYVLTPTVFDNMGRFRSLMASGDGPSGNDNEIRSFATAEEMRAYTQRSTARRGHRALLGSQLTWSHVFARTRSEMTHYSWDYNTRSLVMPYIDAAFLPQLLTEVPVLPQPYYELARVLAKRDFFLRMHELESQPENMNTQLIMAETQFNRAQAALQGLARRKYLNPGDTRPMTSHQRAKLRTQLQADRDSADANLRVLRQRIHLHMDSRRPSREQLEQYYAPKCREKVVQLLTGGHYIEQPGLDYVPPAGAALPEDEEHRASVLAFLADAWQGAVDDLNYAMRGVDMGRNKHLRLSADPGKPRASGRPRSAALPPQQARMLANPLVQEYLQADRDTKLRLLAANPGGLPYLLGQAGVAVAKASYRKPGAPAPAPLRTPAKTPTP